LLDIPGIHSHATLDLEFKDEDGNYEQWNEDHLYIKIVRFTPGTEYDFTRLHSIPMDVITVNFKTDKVSDLEKQLSESFGIPVEKLLIILRHEKSYEGTVTPEWFNMGWRKDKILSECSKFEHGHFLFIEETDPSIGHNNFEWFKLFNAEEDTITLNVNNPETDPEGNYFGEKFSTSKLTSL